MSDCLQLSDFLDAGITTAVGVLGTDTITRSQVPKEPLSHVQHDHNVISPAHSRRSTCSAKAASMLNTLYAMQENLVAKCRGLNDSGMTCYHWCGGYAVPCPTATGSIQRDMCLMDTCLGVGEVAVSDHRSSVPSVNHLANIARCCREPVLICTHPAQSP